MYYDLVSFLTEDGDRLRDLEADQEGAARLVEDCRKQLAAADRQHRQYPTLKNRRVKEIYESLTTRATREHNLIADKFQAALIEALMQEMAGW